MDFRKVTDWERWVIDHPTVIVDMKSGALLTTVLLVEVSTMQTRVAAHGVTMFGTLEAAFAGWERSEKQGVAEVIYVVEE